MIFVTLISTWITYKSNNLLIWDLFSLSVGYILDFYRTTRNKKMIQTRFLTIHNSKDVLGINFLETQFKMYDAAFNDPYSVLYPKETLPNGRYSLYFWLYTWRLCLFFQPHHSALVYQLYIKHCKKPRRNQHEQSRHDRNQHSQNHIGRKIDMKYNRMGIRCHKDHKSSTQLRYD